MMYYYLFICAKMERYLIEDRVSIAKTWYVQNVHHQNAWL